MSSSKSLAASFKLAPAIPFNLSAASCTFTTSRLRSCLGKPRLEQELRGEKSGWVKARDVIDKRFVGGGSEQVPDESHSLPYIIIAVSNHNMANVS